jgi:hypothetical protein
MATQGTNNNKSATIRRVTSSSDTNTVSFNTVTQGQLDTLDPSAIITTRGYLTKVDVALGGTTSPVPIGGKKDFKFVKNIYDYPQTGEGGTKMIDIYGRVLVIDGTDIIVDKTASGNPKFTATAVVFDDDNSPGNGSFETNKGLTYYTKMSSSYLPQTLSVEDTPPLP